MSIKKFRILLDMDNVLFDTVDYWLSLYNDRTKEGLSLSDITDYGFNFLPKEKRDFLFSLLHVEGFFKHIKPISGAVEVVKKIQEDGYDISVVTCGMLGNSVKDKLESLEKHFPFLGNPQKYTIFTHRKDLINGNILFDDNPRNLNQFSAVGGITCAMGYEYNKNTFSNYRVDNRDWPEFYNIIVKIYCHYNINSNYEGWCPYL
jgi:5'-nucleotidase